MLRHAVAFWREYTLVCEFQMSGSKCFIACSGLLSVVLLSGAASAYSVRTGSVDRPIVLQAQYDTRYQLTPPLKPLDRPVEPGDSLRPGQVPPTLPLLGDANRPQFNPPPGAYPPGSARPGSLPPPIPDASGPLPVAPPIGGLPSSSP